MERDSFLGRHWAVTRAGRTLYLGQLLQFPTYGYLTDVRAGNSRKRNEHFRRGLLEKSRTIFSTRAAVLIEPEVTYLDVDLPEHIRLGLRELGEATERLPETTCIAQLHSEEPTSSSPEDDYSSLVVAWCQADFAPPFDAGARSQIEALDWDVLAESWQP